LRSREGVLGVTKALADHEPIMGAQLHAKQQARVNAIVETSKNGQEKKAWLQRLHYELRVARCSIRELL